MIDKNCFVHGDKNFPTQIGHITKVGSKYVYGEVTIPVVNMNVLMRVKFLLKDLPKKEAIKGLEGRYFASSRKGKIHLCTCTWSQDEIDAVKNLADSMFENLNTEAYGIAKD